jgi:hypothetical protein
MKHLPLIIILTSIAFAILFGIYWNFIMPHGIQCGGYNAAEVLFKGTLDKYEVIGWDDFGGTQCNLSFSDIETVKGATEQYRGYYGVYIGSWKQDIVVGHQYIVSEGHIHNGLLLDTLIDWDKGANLKELWNGK